MVENFHEKLELKQKYYHKYTRTTTNKKKLSTTATLLKRNINQVKEKIK